MREVLGLPRASSAGLQVLGGARKVPRVHGSADAGQRSERSTPSKRIDGRRLRWRRRLWSLRTEDRRGTAEQQPERDGSPENASPRHFEASAVVTLHEQERAPEPMCARMSPSTQSASCASGLDGAVEVCVVVGLIHRVGVRKTTIECVVALVGSVDRTRCDYSHVRSSRAWDGVRLAGYAPTSYKPLALQGLEKVNLLLSHTPPAQGLI